MHNIFLSAKIVAPYVRNLLRARISHQHTIKGGLTLPVIENFIILISFLRFTFFAFRYNLRTSFIITCIGISASILWYAHLAKVIGIYRLYIMKSTALAGLQTEILKTYANSKFMEQGEEYQVPWYRPGFILYYGLAKGITHNNHYIDPISMIMSILPEPLKVKLLPLYYNTYNQFIPACAKSLGNLWDQLGEIALYTAIARLARRFCPYLVRWHWSFIIILIQIEYLITNFFDRSMFFRYKVLTRRVNQHKFTGLLQTKLNFEIVTTDFIITFLICSHIGLIIFGLIHALLGQYFYIPFLVENTEVHTGFRPTNSIYSRGETPWQKKKKIEFLSNIFYYSMPKLTVIFGLTLSVGYIFFKGLGSNSII